MRLCYIVWIFFLLISKISFGQNQKEIIYYDHQWYGISLNMRYDFVIPYFDEFSNIIGVYNTDLLNEESGTFCIELSGSYKRYVVALQFGVSEDSDNESAFDSLQLEKAGTSYGLNFRYNLIDSKRILLQPEFSLKWYRYHLLNYDLQRKISLNQYLVNRDLDIRFNQLLGSLGLCLSYKFFLPELAIRNYYSVGIYCGYLFKLSDNPWIYSKRNRLITNEKIDFLMVNPGINVNLSLFF